MEQVNKEPGNISRGKGEFLAVLVVVSYQRVTVAFNLDEFDDVAVSFDFLFPIEA